MPKTKSKDIEATKGPKIYAPISPAQFAIMREIKNRTGLSIANQIRAKVREIEANFREQNPGYKAG